MNSPKQPYSLELSRAYRIKQAFIAGSFLTAFFLVFQPFGLKSESPGYVLTASMGYGLATMIVASCNNILLPSVFEGLSKQSCSRIGRTVYGLWYWASTTAAMVLVNQCLSAQTEFSAKSVLQMSFYVFVLGYLVSILLNHLDRKLCLRKQDAVAALPKQTEEAISQELALSLPYGYENTLKLDDIVYIEARGNYVRITRQSENQEPRTTTVRESLKEIEKQCLNHPRIFRCHRSYLLNLDKIRNIAGDAQGLTVSFETIGHEVPVARSKIKEFKKIVSI